MTEEAKKEETKKEERVINYKAEFKRIITLEDGNQLTLMDGATYNQALQSLQDFWAIIEDGKKKAEVIGDNAKEEKVEAKEEVVEEAPVETIAE